MGTFTKDDIDGVILIRVSNKLNSEKQLTQEEYDMLRNTANLKPSWYEFNLKETVKTSQSFLEYEKQLGYKHCRHVDIW